MNFHLYKTKCQNVAFFPCLFHSISSIRGRCFHGVSSKFWSTFQRFTKCFQRRSILSSCFPRDRSNIHQRKHNCHRSQLTNLQNSVPVKTPIKCDLNLTKKELHKLTFDRLANIFTHSDIFFHSVKCFSHHRIFFYIVKYFSVWRRTTVTRSCSWASCTGPSWLPSCTGRWTCPYSGETAFIFSCL